MYQRKPKACAPSPDPRPTTRPPWTPGWHDRGYLPHFDVPDRLQFVTIRTHDSLPASAIAALDADIARSRAPGPIAQRMRTRGIEAIVDAGYGSCPFRDPRAAAIVQDALRFGDGSRYALRAWVIMPNHAHVLVRCLPGVRLGRVIGDWKSVTARQCHARLRLPSRLWQKDYYDRAIRDEAHLGRALAYVRSNPVAAGLVEKAEEWAFLGVAGVERLR